MIVKPGEFAPGQKYRPGMLQRLAAGVREAIPARQAGVSTHRTRLGTTREEDEIQSGPVILVGVITTAITARTGVYPDFVYGAGIADILNDSGSGVAYSTGVSSTFRDEIPASTEPVLFGVRADGKIFYLNGDC